VACPQLGKPQSGTASPSRIALAVTQKMKLRHLAQMIAPYPTWSELDKAAALEFYKVLRSPCENWNTRM
jgi:hypothetical protein